MKVKVLQNILSANDQIAARNRARLDDSRVLAVNIMSSPGAGKTTLIVETIRRLRDRVKIAVIEADIASTIDADKIAGEGVPALQINTGGQCHIDANMVASALDTLSLEDIDLLLVENVGNLVCPAEFKIGTQRNVMLLSVPEGDDKPYKYPLMFTTTDAIIVSKLDYLPLSDFNRQAFQRSVRGLNHGARLFELSCKTGAGVSKWTAWLESQLKR